MAASNNDIVLAIRQVGNFLNGSLDRAAQKATIDMEDYIQRRILSGGTDEEIFDEIMESLLGEDNARILGSYQVDVKTAVTGAGNMAATHAQLAEIVSEGGEEQEMRWQANGLNVCPDCQARHGEVDTLSSWMVRGLPTEFGSRCGVHCQCMLVPVPLQLEPVRVGA